MELDLFQNYSRIRQVRATFRAKSALAQECRDT